MCRSCSGAVPSPSSLRWARAVRSFALHRERNFTHPRRPCTQLTLQVHVWNIKRSGERFTLLCVLVLVLFLFLLFSFVGAGDTFIGAFAVFFAGGVSLRESGVVRMRWRGGHGQHGTQSRLPDTQRTRPALLRYSAARLKIYFMFHCVTV